VRAFAVCVQALDPFDDIGPRPPKPDSVLVTLKLSSIFTV